MILNDHFMPPKKHNYLIEVYKDTRRLSKKFHPDASPSQSTKYNMYDIIESETRVSDEAETDAKEAKITIKNEDTLVAARNLIQAGYNPLVLNFASDKCPGGGVGRGARAQEECLFRASSYNDCISRELYPLDMADIVVTVDVLVFRDEKHGLLEEGVLVDFIAVAAIRHPKVKKGKFLDDNQRKITRDKVESIFAYASQSEREYDCLVLGALGCGAFHNPPQDVADIFLEMQNK